MLFYYQSWMFYNHYIVILYHFLVLTYWHSTKCQLLFSACFLHHRKSISNGVQTQRNFLWNFFGPEDIQWAKEVPKREPEVSTIHHDTPGGQARPPPFPPPRGSTDLISKYPGCLLVQEKSSRRFYSVWYSFSAKLKNKEKIETGTGL